MYITLKNSTQEQDKKMLNWVFLAPHQKKQKNRNIYVHRLKTIANHFSSKLGDNRSRNSE